MIQELTHRLAHQSRLMVAALRLLLVTALVGGLGIAAIPSASAGDGRALNPAGELTALYIHGLDRAPDPGGFKMYLDMMNGDCKWNTLRASYDILTSQEATNRWRTTENLVGALYASLLDRAPDPGGFRTYVDLSRARGFPASVVSVMASSEYKGRLNAICAGRPGQGATMYNLDGAISTANQLWDASKYLAGQCGVNSVKTAVGVAGVSLTMTALKAMWTGVTTAINVNALVGSCQAWWQIFSAVYYAYDVSYAGYTTFWRIDGAESRGYPHNHCTNWIRIGTDPSHWNTYTVKYDCGNHIWPF